MLKFTWNVFSKTGNIETYLLLKDLEREGQDIPDQQIAELAEIDSPIS
ncbi:YqzL family protein [Ectobacillus panaciterrae]|nr:YqzL family protein [Ectobacillus panaciterrae]